jgi:hypothetical protein
MVVVVLGMAVMVDFDGSGFDDDGKILIPHSNG